VADKIMRAEAQLSAKDVNFSSTLAKMGAALKGLGRASKSISGLPGNLGSSARGLAAAGKASRSLRGVGMMSAAAGGLGDHLASLATVGGAAYGASKLIGAGQKAQHEKLRMEASGMAANEIKEANDQALELARKIPNFDQTTIMHMLRNARTIVGSYEEAANLMEPMLKLRVLAQAARPGEDVSEDFDQLLKGLEIKGVTQNPKEFKEYMTGIAKGINAFGDTLKPYQYYEMFKYGRQATPALSQEFMLSTAPTLAQELGGSSYGKAVSAFSQAVVSGVMKKSATDEFKRLGLADPKQIVKDDSGETVGFRKGSIKGADIAQVNPFEWVREYLLPAMAKKGITSKEDILKEIGVLFQNQMAGQMVSMLATQISRILKDQAIVHGAKGLEAADAFNSRDGGMALSNLKTQAGSAMQELGKDLADSLAGPTNEAAKALANYTARLHEATEARKDHPDEVAPGQKRFNALADGMVNDLIGTPDQRAEQDYRRRFSELVADIKAQKESVDRLKAFVEKNPNSAHAQDQLSKAQASLDQLARQAYDLVAAHQAVADLKKSAEEAAAALKQVADLRINQPGAAPGTIPEGPAAFPLSKGYGGLDANGAPIPRAAPTRPEEKPFNMKEFLNGKIEAKLDGRVPVDVTGKVALEGKADVSVKIKVDGPGRVTGLNSSSSGNIRASVGSTMPGAGSANGGATP
jgi:hypothetical protein